MNKNYSLLRALLVFFVLFFQSYIYSQDLWSDSSSWSSGVVPSAGADVVIPSGKTIILDINTPSLGTLTIHGTLKLKDANIYLTARWIMVHGLLQIGTSDTPFQNKATITLTGPKEDVNGMGGRFLITMEGGSLEFHGASASKLSWGQLDRTVAPGDTQITLDKDPTGWKIGDKIAIAPSGYDPYETEEVIITAINGKTISFLPALQYAHFGELQEYEGKILDERAEVGMLSRNIKIQGAQDAVTQRYGGHTMIMNNSGAIHIEGTEFTRMGQPGIGARYSFHWHLAGDREGDYIKNSSIHHGLQRAVVVHQTDNVLVENVVAFDIQNHAFVPGEDGNEVNNTFKNNLAMLVRKPDEGFFAFPKDGQGGSSQSEQRVAGFWMRSPHNNLIGNHAAGSEKGIGFFFDVRNRDRKFKDFDLLPRKIVFDDNVAHSSSVPGSLTHEGISNHALYTQVGFGHGFLLNKFKNDDLMWTFSNFTSYKNAMGGVWTEILNLTIDNFMVADNAIGLLTSESYVKNTIVVGRSANEIGGPNRNLRHGDRRAGYYSIAEGGFKKPKFTGVTFIDINKDIEEDKVAAAVVGHSSHFDENFFEDIKIVGNTSPVWMSTRGRKGKNENTSFLLDKDGSLTGYNKPVLIAHPYSSLKEKAIDYREEWQAYIVDAQNVMQLKMNRVGFDLEQELSLIREADGFRVPKMQWAHQRFFRFIGQQQYTVIGQWDFDSRGQSLELFSILKYAGQWTTFKHPFPYTEIKVLDRDENAVNQVADLQALNEQQDTSYYFDIENGIVYVKMVTDQEGKDWVNLFPLGEKTGNNFDIDTGSVEQFFRDIALTPNPLTYESKLEYTLLQDEFVSIDIFDILGRNVKQVLSEDQKSGTHSIPINDLVMQSGVYILNIRIADLTFPIKMIKQ